MSQKPAPKPKLTSKPKSIKVFTATWGYQAQAEDELTFDEGDNVYVSEQNGDWWKGIVLVLNLIYTYVFVLNLLFRVIITCFRCLK